MCRFLALLHGIAAQVMFPALFLKATLSKP